MSLFVSTRWPKKVWPLANAHFCFCLWNASTKLNNFRHNLAAVYDKCCTEWYTIHIHYRARLKWNNCPLFLTSSSNYPAVGWRTVPITHSQKHNQLPAAWKRQVHPAYDVATKQSRLDSGRLCSVGSPAAANVLWSTVWHCGTVEAGNCERMACAMFIGRCINERQWHLVCCRVFAINCCVSLPKIIRFG